MKKYNVTIAVEQLSQEARNELFNFLEKNEPACKISRLFGWRSHLSIELPKSPHFMVKYLQEKDKVKE